MSAFDDACAATLRLEGNYSNDPRDPGGETKYGITFRTARGAGYTGAMVDLTLEQAREIYRIVFWRPLLLDQVAAFSPRLASELFDTNVNFYSGAAATFLQRSLVALGALPTGSVDGVIGAQTVTALSRFLQARGDMGEFVMLRCLNALQCADYIRQVEANPAKRGFLFGWVRARVVI